MDVCHFTASVLGTKREESGRKPTVHTFLPTPYIHHVSIQSVTTCLSTPVANDEGSYGEADDKVDINDVS